MTGTAQKIKQKLKEVTSPSPPPVDASNANASPNLNSNSNQDPIPHHKSSSSFSNIFHHHHNSNSNSNSNSSGHSGLLPPGEGAPIQPIESGDSIASEPGNYLTDKQLEQDLVLEEMAERQDSIGHQSVPVDNSSGISAPPPPAEKPSGGMYGNAFGGGGGGGGKKKGSKQKFAERQVSPPFVPLLLMKEE